MCHHYYLQAFGFENPHKMSHLNCAIFINKTYVYDYDDFFRFSKVSNPQFLLVSLEDICRTQTKFKNQTLALQKLDKIPFGSFAPMCMSKGCWQHQQQSLLISYLIYGSRHRIKLKEYVKIFFIHLLLLRRRTGW